MASLEDSASAALSDKETRYLVIGVAAIIILIVLYEVNKVVNTTTSATSGILNTILAPFQALGSFFSNLLGNSESSGSTTPGFGTVQNFGTGSSGWTTDPTAYSGGNVFGGLLNNPDPEDFTTETTGGGDAPNSQ